MKVTDWQGTPIEVGSRIVYAKTVSRSAALTIGEVIEVIPYTTEDYNRPHPPEKYPAKLKVRPIADAYEVYHGRDPLSRRGGYDYNSYDESKPPGQRMTKTPPKDVILRHMDRIMVIPQVGDLTS